ncbi:MAG: sodium-dependent transporter [Bacteroidales bacterium]|nr:sodium-dependent transporter [Candidatus Cacconaster merdequi]
MKDLSEKRESFAGSMTAIMAMAGSAVGLGNLWRFPYLMGENGGATFIAIYLLLAIFICLPIILVEFIIGRRSQKNIYGAFEVLAPGKPWKLIGICCTLAPILVLSFYSVVGGWSINYLLKALSFSFTGENSNPEYLSSLFSNFVTDPYKPLLFHTLFLGMTAVIVAVGVKKGIERFSKIVMPLLFVMIIIIVVKAVTLPGSSAGLNYIFKPDFSKVTSETVLKALGQAFFSLSLGCGTMVTYASYVGRKENLLKCSAGTVFFDTIFALLAGCAIMPAVFAYGINPSEGPGLVFVTLPHIFSQMTAGGPVAIIFFFSLLIAALTSSISLLEVLTALLTEELHLKRTWAVVISFFLFWILGAACSLSQGVLSDVLVFGKNIFDLFDYISANILMLAGGLLLTIFVGWALGKKVIREELTNDGSLRVPPVLLQTIVFLIRYVAPAAIIAIFIFQTIS